MKIWKQGVLLLMLLAVLLVVCGCNKNNTTPTDPAAAVTTEPEPTEDLRQAELAALYDAAVEAVNGDSLAMEVDYERTVTVGGQTYKESGEVNQDYWNIGGEDFLAKIKQKVTYGDDAYDIKLEEIYSEGKVYQELEDSKILVEMTPEAFMERYTPLKLLDPSLYTLSADESETVITFSDGIAGEGWLLPEDAVINSASGTVELDSAGKLKKTTYTVDYQYGVTNICLTYEAELEEEGRKPSIPEKVEKYTQLSEIDAAYILEHAYGYLSQAKHISSNTSSLMMTAAGACSLINSVQLDVYAVGGEYAARLEKNINLTDYSSGEEVKQEQVEKFVDGKYTVSQDGGREESDSSVEQADMENAVTDQLLGWILSGDSILEAEMTELDGVLLVEYTGAEILAEEISARISSTFFGSGSVLDNAASSYRTNEIEYYIALDSYSLLPTAVGVKYEGVHVIDGNEFILSQQMDQSFDMASLNAYDEIFEESAPEEEPENPATPLFYHVTGEDGQEMWLLGTIHVGDVRTGFLPQDIYDAFYASDAFAIECNNDTFAEQLEEDEELQEMLSECYFYSDGTTAKDHIETEDLYETAVQFLKASGNYNFNSEYEMLHLWSSYIEHFYMQQGYTLTSEKGVENRLLALAEEEDIPVWEVESVQLQLEMLANYSDHLQEFMLFSSLAAGAQENWEATLELYELWCAGDEASLIERIAVEESWQIDEEDIDLESLEGEDLEKAQAVLADLDNINAELVKLQEEYNTAISVDRNEGMLEVAKSYLESGDTIFYAVGLAHLLAENGLVNALREAGYTVELVSFQ